MSKERIELPQDVLERFEKLSYGFDYPEACKLQEDLRYYLKAAYTHEDAITMLLVNNMLLLMAFKMSKYE
jgi:hypothetical protein